MAYRNGYGNEYGENSDQYNGYTGSMDNASLKNASMTGMGAGAAGSTNPYAALLNHVGLKSAPIAKPQPAPALPPPTGGPSHVGDPPMYGGGPGGDPVMGGGSMGYYDPFGGSTVGTPPPIVPYTGPEKLSYDGGDSYTDPITGNQFTSKVVSQDQGGDPGLPGGGGGSGRVIPPIYRVAPPPAHPAGPTPAPPPPEQNPGGGPTTVAGRGRGAGGANFTPPPPVPGGGDPLTKPGRVPPPPPGDPAKEDFVNSAREWAKQPGWGWVQPQDVKQYRDWVAQDPANRAGVDAADYFARLGRLNPDQGRRGSDTAAGMSSQDIFQDLPEGTDYSPGWQLRAAEEKQRKLGLDPVTGRKKAATGGQMTPEQIQKMINDGISAANGGPNGGGSSTSQSGPKGGYDVNGGDSYLNSLLDSVRGKYTNAINEGDRALRSKAALTGMQDSGGFGDVMGDYYKDSYTAMGNDLANPMFQASEAERGRALQDSLARISSSDSRYVSDNSLTGQRYSADQGLAGAKANAAAGSSAARAQAAASQANARLQYQLGQQEDQTRRDLGFGGLDVQREGNGLNYNSQQMDQFFRYLQFINGNSPDNIPGNQPTPPGGQFIYR